MLRHCSTVRFQTERAQTRSYPAPREKRMNFVLGFSRGATIGLHWNQIVLNLLEIKDILEKECV